MRLKSAVLHVTVCESLCLTTLGCLKLVLSGVAHKTGRRFTAGEMPRTLVLIENTAETRGPVCGDHRGGLDSNGCLR